MDLPARKIHTFETLFNDSIALLYICWLFVYCHRDGNKAVTKRGRRAPKV
jgi:hypothetical protein